MFISLFESGVTANGIILASCISIISGLIIALGYKVVARHGKEFFVTLSVLPLMVMAVIMLVNGNLGIGVAVAGSFSLIRFRSLPGKSSDIAIVFLAMATGLATGVGYVWVALAISIVLSVLIIIFNKIPIFETSNNTHRYLKVLMPEDGNPNELFNEVLNKYCSSYSLTGMRTVDLGSLYEIDYDINLKDANKEKELIDELRIRNGNLTVKSSVYGGITSTTL